MRCPITYLEISDSGYSDRGLRRLSSRLTAFHGFPYTYEEQLRRARSLATEASLPGKQPKMSARLNSREGCFEPASRGGNYILKLQDPSRPEIPENEDLSMRLAKSVGIEVPLHGLVYGRDRSLVYFIRRFDRPAKRKLAVEDMAQLTGLPRERRCDLDLADLAPVLEAHCTFPALEKLKLFRLTLFNYLIGNQTAHAKNLTLVRHDGKIELSPAYDLVNTSILPDRRPEETALSIGGKRGNLVRGDLLERFPLGFLQLTQRAVSQVEEELRSGMAAWPDWIGRSFLRDRLKAAYTELIDERRAVLAI